MLTTSLPTLTRGEYDARAQWLTDALAEKRRAYEAASLAATADPAKAAQRARLRADVRDLEEQLQDLAAAWRAQEVAVREARDTALQAQRAAAAATLHAHLATMDDAVQTLHDALTVAAGAIDSYREADEDARRVAASLGREVAEVYTSRQHLTSADLMELGERLALHLRHRGPGWHLGPVIQQRLSHTRNELRAMLPASPSDDPSR